MKTKDVFDYIVQLDTLLPLHLKVCLCTICYAQPRFTNSRELPSTTEEAKALSKKFKKANFKFMGPVVCYAFMQANGLTNDHSLECFLYQSV